MGPERLGVFAIFYDWARDGHGFPMIGSGRNRYQLLDVEDLCESIYLCCTLDRDRVNDVFNIGAAEFTTMGEDFQAVLDESRLRPEGSRISRQTRSSGPCGCWKPWAFPPLYKWVYETACEDSFVSIDKARRVLGFQPRYSNKQALIRNYRWYLDHVDQLPGHQRRLPPCSLEAGDSQVGQAILLSSILAFFRPRDGRKRARSRAEGGCAMGGARAGLSDRLLLPAQRITVAALVAAAVTLNGCGRSGAAHPRQRVLLFQACWRNCQPEGAQHHIV